MQVKSKKFKVYKVKIECLYLPHPASRINKDKIKLEKSLKRLH